MKKEENIVSYSAEEIKKLKAEGKWKSETDWKRVDSMTEEELEAAIASDPDSDFTADWSKAFKGLPDIPGAPWKEKISIRVDKSVLDWFKKRGKGYQTHMNAVLRSYVDAQK